jgi:hypothetical protein
MTPWTLALLHLLSVTAVTIRAQGERVHVLGGSARLQSILDLAARRAVKALNAPECGSLFSEFRDARGRPLQQNLDARGETAPEYLVHTLRFADGSLNAPRCQSDQIAALTAPGSLVVMVCPAQLERVAREDLRYAAAVLIHETLHTLGLGENPPSSEEITGRVLARCR